MQGAVAGGPAIEQSGQMVAPDNGGHQSRIGSRHAGTHGAIIT